MESKIHVKHDFDKNQTYIQIYCEKDMEKSADLRDMAFYNFLERANNTPLVLTFPKNAIDNKTPQIKLVSPDCEVGLKTALLGTFENFAFNLIDGAFPQCERNPRQIVSDFFNLMYDCTDPKLKGVKDTGTANK